MRKIAAAAAADVKNVQEFVAEKDGRDVDGQQVIDAVAKKGNYQVKLARKCYKIDLEKNRFFRQVLCSK